MSNREIVRRLYEDCVNTGNVALLPTLVANDYVGPNGDRGPAGYEQIVTGLRTGFPDIHFTLDELLTFFRGALTATAVLAGRFGGWGRSGRKAVKETSDYQTLVRAYRKALQETAALRREEG